MEIKDKILKALGLSQEVKLGYQAKLEDGTIITSSSDELAVGVDISILMEDGTSVPLPIGEYSTEDGTGFSVTEEGKVAEIYEEETEEEEVEAAEEEAPEEEAPSVEEVVEVIEESVDVVAEAINEATPEEVTPEIAQVAAEAAVAALAPVVEEEVALSSEGEAILEVLRKEIADMKDTITDQKSAIETLSKQPAGTPIKANKFSVKTNKGVEKKYSEMDKREKFMYNFEKN